MTTTLSRGRGGKSRAKDQFKEEGFFESHLYTLERPTTLLDKEKKQVSLLEAHGIGVNKKLIFWGANYYYRGNYGQVVGNQKGGGDLEPRGGTVRSGHRERGRPDPPERLDRRDGEGGKEEHEALVRTDEEADSSLQGRVREGLSPRAAPRPPDWRHLYVIGSGYSPESERAAKTVPPPASTYGSYIKSPARAGTSHAPLLP